MVFYGSVCVLFIFLFPFRVLREQWIRAKYERLEFQNSERQSYLKDNKTGYLLKRGRDDGKFNSRKFQLFSRDNQLIYFTREGVSWKLTYQTYICHGWLVPKFTFLIWHISERINVTAIFTSNCIRIIKISVNEHDVPDRAFRVIFLLVANWYNELPWCAVYQPLPPLCRLKHQKRRFL